MLRDQPLETGLEFEPLSLSVRPLEIETGESEYSHVTQVREYGKNSDIVMYTANGTFTGNCGMCQRDYDSD